MLLRESEIEGVSLNNLVVSFISERLGKKTAASDPVKNVALRGLHENLFGPEKELFDTQSRSMI